MVNVMIESIIAWLFTRFAPPPRLSDAELMEIAERARRTIEAAKRAAAAHPTFSELVADPALDISDLPPPVNVAVMLGRAGCETEAIKVLEGRTTIAEGLAVLTVALTERAER
jgi:hypothetical protein